MIGAIEVEGPASACIGAVLVDDGRPACPGREVGVCAAACVENALMGKGVRGSAILDPGYTLITTLSPSARAVLLSFNARKSKSVVSKTEMR